MKVLGNWVWVNPILPEEISESGIILSSGAIKQKPTQGVVVAIGNKCDFTMLDGLAVGDVVSFSPDHIRVQEHPTTGEELFRFQDRNLDYKVL